MKYLYILRHAKTSWDSVTDFTRQLDSTGKLQAKHLGKFLKQRGIHFDAIHSSSATRASQTTHYIAEEIEFKISSIEETVILYEAKVIDLLQYIHDLPNSHNTVLIVGHNNTVSNFCNYILTEPIGDLPTCGLVAIRFSLSSWAEVDKQIGELLLYKKPDDSQ